MNNNESFTYIEEERSFIPGSTEYNRKLVLGYPDAGMGTYAATLTADAEGVSSEQGDKALWFNGIYSGAFAPYSWVDAENVAVELYVKPYSFQSEQTIIYATSCFEIRLAPTSQGARINFNVWHNNGTAAAYSPSALVLNEWNHIQAFAGNGKALVVVNGQSSNTINIPNVRSSYDAGIYFGSTHQFNTRFYSGLLDDVEIAYRKGSCSITGYAQADLNKDCYVNLPDMAILAGEWLKCSDPDLFECEDMR
jgi:hypothetical protein